MLEVDFNEATLKGGSFRYGISLEHCLFPNGPLYIFIKNPKETFERAIKKIEGTWAIEDKDLAIRYIKAVYYTNTDKDPENVFMDKHIFLEEDGEEFANAFFKVINEANAV
ncbi:hypothetical protein BWZ22_03920 [Seonamhaeicola sp. S2-3]|uniref:hypothetical protein n=1 Tax=Seonamhaeicola sp. S2-3 TaxID=1936081 RepID=UPI000972C8D7|nr:hypothetical protein [Seonamhaeicola sp. S2-3]APY10439.1 hypothetical protein BWZ22_03920 [Seonamhaeicola sp. S2-3]